MGNVQNWDAVGRLRNGGQDEWLLVEAKAHIGDIKSGTAPGVYVTLNPVNPDLLARSANKAEPFARHTTGDADIIHRAWIPLDFDPVRPAGISSTDEEHQAALIRAQECLKWLADRGWTDPIEADSGNGAHLLYPVDLPNEPDSTELIRQALVALANIFDDSVVKVDTSTYNASRIWKVYGTAVCKGSSLPDRPHRLSAVLNAPTERIDVILDQLRDLAKLAPKTQAKGRTQRRSRSRNFDLAAWIANSGLAVASEAPYQEGHKWVLEICPWNQEHTDKSAFIIQFKNGAISAGCHHDGCSGKGWADLKELVESDRDGSSLTEALERLDNLSTKLKEDPGFAFKEETLDALSTVENLDKPEFARAWDCLRKAKVPLKQMRQELKHRHRLSSRFKQDDIVKVGQTAGEMLGEEGVDDCPAPELVIPEPYFVASDSTGIIKMVKNKETDEWEEHRTTIAYAPMLISGRKRDLDQGEEYLTLNWRRSEGWRNKIVGRDVALDEKKLISLAAGGFPVASDNARKVAHYLHSLEAANWARLPTEKVSSHLGWQGSRGDSGFLWGTSLILDGRTSNYTDPGLIAFLGKDPGEEQLAKGFHERGSLEEWLKAVTVLEHYPKALLALYASLVPPLLVPLEIPNFIIDFFGRTTTGKTTVLMVAASVWGCPDLRNPAATLSTWDATRVFLERSSSVRSDLPVIMDETKEARFPKIVSEQLYAVANGRGRGRGNTKGVDQARTWHTVLLSSGESPAVSFTQDGGTRTRVLEVRGSPFGTADEATRRLVDDLRAGILRSYGWAGPMFVQWLMRHRDQWPAFADQYKSLVAEFAQSMPGPEAGRLAHYAAAINLAATLAHAALPFPWDFKRPLEGGLWEDLALEAVDAAGESRALHDVFAWAQAHPESFWGRHRTDSEGQPIPPFGGWAGRWDDTVAWDTIGFFEPALKKALIEMKYEPAAILGGWREKGWIDTDGDRKRYTKKVRVNGEQARLVVIPRTALEEADA